MKLSDCLDKTVLFQPVDPARMGLTAMSVMSGKVVAVSQNRNCVQIYSKETEKNIWLNVEDFKVLDIVPPEKTSVVSLHKNKL